jgi:hypothetical protein
MLWKNYGNEIYFFFAAPDLLTFITCFTGYREVEPPLVLHTEMIYKQFMNIRKQRKEIDCFT